jgi:hypothetical protein
LSLPLHFWRGLSTGEPEMAIKKHYFVQGFYIEIAPGRRAVADVFFEVSGRTKHLNGLDLHSKDGVYLGFVPPHNISLETAAIIREYIEKHRNKWIELHKSEYPSLHQQGKF